MVQVFSVYNMNEHLFVFFIFSLFVSISHCCICPPFCPPPTTTTTRTSTTSTTTTSPTTTTSSRVECECGEVNRPSRIAGGSETGPHEYPWNVVLCFGSGGLPNCPGLCGGSLITTRHVLTAAHCVDGGTNKDDVHLFLGKEIYHSHLWSD